MCNTTEIHRGQITENPGSNSFSIVTYSFKKHTYLVYLNILPGPIRYESLQSWAASPALSSYQNMFLFALKTENDAKLLAWKAAHHKPMGKVMEGRHLVYISHIHVHAHLHTHTALAVTKFYKSLKISCVIEVSKTPN